MEDQDRKPRASFAPVDVSLTIDSRRAIVVTFWICLGAELGFVVLDATVNYSRWTDYGMIRRLFNITREDGCASWFGVMQTLMVAVTAWWIWVLSRRAPGAGRRPRGWLFLAIVMTYMALDDGAKIHERLGSMFKKAVRIGALDGEDGLGAALLGWFPSYPWQILFVPIFAVVGTVLLVFLIKELRSKLSIFLVVAGLGLFAAATGLDFIEGLDPDHPLNLYGTVDRAYDWDGFTTRHFHEDPYDAMRHFGKSVEEFLEMFGMTLIWIALLRHLGERFRKIDIELIRQPR